MATRARAKQPADKETPEIDYWDCTVTVKNPFQRERELSGASDADGDNNRNQGKDTGNSTVIDISSDGEDSESNLINEEWFNGTDEDDEDDEEAKHFPPSTQLFNRISPKALQTFQAFYKLHGKQGMDRDDAIHIPGLKRPIKPYQAFGAMYMLQSKGPLNGGFLADEMGLGKTIIVYTAFVIHRWISLMDDEVRHARDNNLETHLARDTTQDCCPSAANFPIRCLCEKNSPTRALRNDSRGPTLIFAPFTLLSVWATPEDQIWTVKDLKQLRCWEDPAASLFGRHLLHILKYFAKWDALRELIQGRPLDATNANQPAKMLVLGFTPVEVLIFLLREEVVSRFQDHHTGEMVKGRRSPGILLGSIWVMSAGITLTKATHTVLLELQFLLTWEEQGKARAYWTGQTQETYSYWLIDWSSKRNIKVLRQHAIRYQAFEGAHSVTDRPKGDSESYLDYIRRLDQNHNRYGSGEEAA
ncbi:hypothetical protein BJX76DRAFT_363151 [Aspergillus varians]